MLNCQTVVGCWWCCLYVVETKINHPICLLYLGRVAFEKDSGTGPTDGPKCPAAQPRVVGQGRYKVEPDLMT